VTEAHTITASGGVAFLVGRWAHLYNNTKGVSIAVTYGHFAGMLVGGGFAVVADRDAFRLSPATVAAPGTRASFATIHRWVLGGLAVVFLSGILMMLADLDTYVASPVFWIKMSLFALLIANGYGRMRAEEALAGGSAAGWRWLRRTSAASLALWLAVLLTSTILNNS
jgi:hypothetical protein